MNKKKISLALLLGSFLPLASVLAADAVTLDAMVLNIKTIAVTIATPIVVIGWIIAGILYLTAAGSPERTGIAKKAMIAALMGTILVVLAIGSAAIIGIIQNALGLGAGTP